MLSIKVLIYKIYKFVIYFFLKNSYDLKKKGKTRVETKELSKEKEEKDNNIYCRNCKNVISSKKNIISVNGSHIHNYKNPAGIIFEIGCFSKAEGCLITGEPTLEYTWFPGYKWNYAVCKKCLFHLGWYYQSGDKSFFGLIIERLLFS